MTGFDPEHWRRVEALLGDALAQPVASRNDWLRHHCDDPRLRAEVQALLDADAHSGPRLEALAAAAREWYEPAPAGADAATDWPRIPGYRIVGLLGEGGMASVFHAERSLGDAVQQVALKRMRMSVFF